jgi:NADH:ubiquinone oxidoreductase subunit
VDIQIRLLTWFRGQLMGTDSAGNRYYQHKSSKRQPRRWVIYRGLTEASRIPPLWHAWLHHTLVEPPTHYQAHPWEKPHQPNLTGTPYAYHPHGHPVQTYEPWSPKDISKDREL